MFVQATYPDKLFSLKDGKYVDLFSEKVSKYSATQSIIIKYFCSQVVFTGKK